MTDTGLGGQPRHVGLSLLWAFSFCLPLPSTFHSIPYSLFFSNPFFSVCSLPLICPCWGKDGGNHPYTYNTLYMTYTRYVVCMYIRSIYCWNIHTAWCQTAYFQIFKFKMGRLNIFHFSIEKLISFLLCFFLVCECFILIFLSRNQFPIPAALLLQAQGEQRRGTRRRGRGHGNQVTWVDGCPFTCPLFQTEFWIKRFI